MKTQGTLFTVALAALAMPLITFVPVDAQGRGTQVETADVLGQEDEYTGERDVVAEDGATLRRGPNGISAQLSMPTPEPETYNYPDPDENPTAAEPGHPEAFTLWAFVFDPEQETFEDQDWAGAFLVGGHVVGGPNLTLRGHISKNTEPVAGEKLENPDAEIHLAVAPHGELDPEIMPEQIKTPAGGPDMWWIAIFEPSE